MADFNWVVFFLNGLFWALALLAYFGTTNKLEGEKGEVWTLVAFCFILAPMMILFCAARFLGFEKSETDDTPKHIYALGVVLGVVFFFAADQSSTFFGYESIFS
ncbi:MAG: hypothetical protein AAF478_12480 [Pseudomonadota bacterium]